MNFVYHLECANCATPYPAGVAHGLCAECERPLWTLYDLEGVAASLRKEDLAAREPNLWRYRELLPYSDETSIVSLGETMTPILKAPRIAEALGLRRLEIKDESRLPTGSFKARGMAMAITMARELGIERVACPTAGNAGGAMAAYAARAGIESFVFMPEDTPSINQKETPLAGAHTFKVNGLINDCGKLVGEGKRRMGWFDLSTLKEPYRIEGKKTMGLELAEQMDWTLPDVILYPTGGGTGLIGMWKAFEELGQLGWLKTDKRPRMIACQSEGCAPIVWAFNEGQRHADPFPNATTVASGLRVPVAVGDFMILDAVRASGGLAIAAPESDILPWMRRLASKEGIFICPETAICFSALDALIQSGSIQPEERVLVFNTGSALKYSEILPEGHDSIDLSQPISWDSMATN